jgi:Kef-type K+ transport system membrane component KefB
MAAPNAAAGFLAAGEAVHTIATPVPLIIIATAAFLIPLFAGRIGLPAIVAEILFGVLIGPVLGVIEPGGELLGFLAELGLFMLMFLAGFEIDFTKLERQGAGMLAGGLMLVGLFIGAAWIGVGFLNTSTVEERLFVMFLLSAAALGLVVPSLRATRRTGTRLGQLILITAVFAEVLGLIGIVVLSVFVESGFGWRLLTVPALVAVIGLVLVILRVAAWWYPERFERLFRKDDPQELGIRASLALLFVLVGLTALLEIEAILGAFLAGSLFTFVFRDPEPLEERLSGFAYGFFIPVFFINVGIEFPLTELRDTDVLIQATALIGVAFAIKLIPSLFLILRRFTIRESLAAGMLLTGQLSVIIALVDLGIGLGLLTAGERAGAIMLVAVSAVIAPIAFRTLAPPLPPSEKDPDDEDPAIEIWDSW